MSMGYGELEAQDNSKPKTKALPRKTISLKLKREAHEPPKEEEYESPKKKDKQEEAKAQDEELNWNFKVKLAAEKKTNILNMCEKCKKPILVHGRLIPCKHFLCLSCAQNGTRTCYKCNKEIIGIQPVPTIYICTSEGTRHSVQGCRKSYLNLRGLAQHQQLRHSERAGDPTVDSDGELSVNQQTQQAAPVPTPVTVQQHPPAALPPSLPPSLPAPHSIPRPMLLPSLSTVTSTPIFTTQNATQSSHIVQRCQIPITAAPPMSVMSMPRGNLRYPTPVSVAQMSVSSVNQQTLLPTRSIPAPHQIMSQVMSPLNLPGMLPRPEFKQFGQGSLLPHLKPPFHPGTLNAPPPGFPHMPSRHMPSNIADMMPPPPPPAPQQVVQSPRDPRKMARDIPPPPPPKNGPVR